MSLSLEPSLPSHPAPGIMAECPEAGVSESQGECFYCQKLSTERCECGVFYCSKECLKIHRPGKYCLPFKVQSKQPYSCKCLKSLMNSLCCVSCRHYNWIYLLPGEDIELSRPRFHRFTTSTRLHFAVPPPVIITFWDQV